VKRVPALVVSGFLGSGKTTLVRHLLRAAQREGLRLAVVSNEYGELGIDQALLGAGGEAFVELAGGCVCCQLTDELVETLEMLRRRVDPDRVIVETSGVALPYDTQLNFWRAPVSGWIGDDLAVVVVNAEQVAAERALEGTFEDQVSSADLLLLNKLDLISPDALPRVEEALADLAPEVPIVRAVQAEVSPELLFPPDPDALRSRPRGASLRPHTHDEFVAEELAIEAGIAPRELEARIRERGALRAKGFVATSVGVRVVQGVGPRIELDPVEEPPPQALLGRVVLIRPVAR
jgi:cobalamin biosynthesis protein CobW